MSPIRRAALTTFLLGLILGAAAGSWGQRAMFRRFIKKGPDAAHMIRRLDRELSLNETQKSAILAILGARRAEIEAVKKDARSRFEAMRAATDADIRKTLQPDQQAKFDAMTARWQARMREREKNGGPPPPP
ncbi:MAG: hypothetical protein KGL74_03320 [Elusimicrobia bacterium]|nr:hypothetical protein [Elusimicrobiota bacterium]MDE2510131.1 hypothetical protein [Elusimicrobiota bacterium]